MTLLVTMHVFSGMPDPQWTIGPDDAQELASLLKKNPTHGVSPEKVGALGYRGFSVIDSEAGETREPLFQVLAADENLIPSHSFTGSAELERFLLWTGRHQPISDEVRQHASLAIESPAIIAPSVQAAACPACHAADAPPYNPAIWNTPQVQPHNNCYNYANNQVTNSFAQPGRASGHPYANLSGPAVESAAQSDGLVPCGNFSGNLAANAGWYVALVIWPGNDYHWYRQDNGGCWSHKPGQTAARNVDNSGQAIADPRSCNRGPYTLFQSFMITRRTVHIR